MRKILFICIFVFLIQMTLSSSLDLGFGTPESPRITLDSITAASDTTTSDGLGSIMYLNIENSFVDPVRWNITQESDNLYNFTIKAGRHWIISGGEI